MRDPAPVGAGSLTSREPKHSINHNQWRRSADLEGPSPVKPSRGTRYEGIVQVASRTFPPVVDFCVWPPLPPRGGTLAYNLWIQRLTRGWYLQNRHSKW